MEPKLREFQKYDYAQIAEWYALWKMPAPPIEMLPKVGVIVDGLGAGFLYQTDCPLGIIDGFISNPRSDQKERDRALDEITDALLSRAKLTGAKCVQFGTRWDAVAKRAKKFGFIETGMFRYFAKEM